MHVLHQGTLYATRRLLPRGIMGDGGVSQRYVTLKPMCVYGGRKKNGAKGRKQGRGRE